MNDINARIDAKLVAFDNEIRILAAKTDVLAELFSKNDRARIASSGKGETATTTIIGRFLGEEIAAVEKALSSTMVARAAVASLLEVAIEAPGLSIVPPTATPPDLSDKKAA